MSALDLADGLRQLRTMISCERSRAALRSAARAAERGEGATLVLRLNPTRRGTAFSMHVVAEGEAALVTPSGEFWSLPHGPA